MAKQKKSTSHWLKNDWDVLPLFYGPEKEPFSKFPGIASWINHET